MGERLFTSKQILTQLMPHQATLGISRIAELSQFIPRALDVSIVQTVRTSITAGQVTSTTGKAWRLTDALCGAFGEALERYCAASIAPTLQQSRASNPASGAREPAVFSYKDGYVPTTVIPAKELISGAIEMVPAIEICYPYHQEEVRKSGFRPNTTGLAAGGNLEEATIHAIYEVIERHASSHFFNCFLKRTTGSMIDERLIPDAALRARFADLRMAGYQCILFSIDALLPTCYVAILDEANLGPKFMVSGICTSSSQLKAINGALLEALQALAIGMQGSREDLLRSQRKYQTQEKNRFDNPFFKIKSILCRLNPLTGVTDVDEGAGHQIGDLLVLLSRAGVGKVYQCDISPKFTPLKTVKVVIPDMFDTFVNPHRMNHAIATT